MREKYRMRKENAVHFRHTNFSNQVKDWAVPKTRAAFAGLLMAIVGCPEPAGIQWLELSARKERWQVAMGASPWSSEEDGRASAGRRIHPGTLKILRPFE